MSFEYNPADEDPHAQCAHRIHELEQGIRQIMAIADRGRAHLDADRDHKALKILKALSGNLPGYLRELDEIFDSLPKPRNSKSRSNTDTNLSDEVREP